VITLAFVQLMSMVTLKTNQQQPSQRYQAKENKPTKMYSLLRNLITKEWKRFINSSIYVVNTSFGLFILVIAAIAAVFARPQIDGILLELGVAEDSLLIALTGLIVFTLVTVYTPAVSLSLEGKNFSLIKSLPLDYRTLFDAKIAFNVLLTIIPLAFAIVLFSIAFNLTVMETVMLFVMMVIFSYAISVVDMWINIFFPRFDFQHEVEVVKKSMAAMISVLGGFGIFGAAIYAHIILLASMSWLFSSLIVSFIVFVIGIGLHSVLHHRANKVIQQLEV
jgi:ABC-2 type transport system permease protein